MRAVFFLPALTSRRHERTQSRGQALGKASLQLVDEGVVSSLASRRILPVDDPVPVAPPQDIARLQISVASSRRDRIVRGRIQDFQEPSDAGLHPRA